MRPGLDTTTDRIAKVKYLVWIVENVLIYFLFISNLLFKIIFFIILFIL